MSLLKTHPDPICAQSIPSNKVCCEVYTVLYRLRRADSKVAEELVEWCLQLIKRSHRFEVVVAHEGLSRRYESEKVLPFLVNFWSL